MLATRGDNDLQPKPKVMITTTAEPEIGRRTGALAAPRKTELVTNGTSKADAPELSNDRAAARKLAEQMSGPGGGQLGTASSAKPLRWRFGNDGAALTGSELSGAAERHLRFSATTMKVKILLVDDHPLLRNGLRQAMEKQRHFTVVGEAATGELALALALEMKPDLVVMDIHLKDMNGLEATRQILSVLPATKIIVFSGDMAGKLVDEALQAGASGYIFKGGPGEELVHAIDGVMAGKLCLSPEVSAAIVEDHQRILVGDRDPPKPALSDREKLLLRLIAEGCRNKEIATKMNLSPNSIETYRVRLMKKVGYRNTAELVRFAVREGIAAP